MAIDTTVGGANANSWASVAEFRAYVAVRVPTNAGITSSLPADSVVEAALIAACRRIEDSVEWTGSAVDNVQALTWPRSGMLSRNNFAIATTVNPNELKNAQCEMAFQMIAGGDFASDDAAAKGNVLGVKAGSVSVQFQQTFSNTTEAVDLAVRKQTSEFAYLTLPGEVRRLLVPSWFNENLPQRPVMFGAM